MKRVITPLDAPQEFLSEANRERAAQATAQDSALMRALGLVHHWQRRLDEVRAASVADIAKTEGMDVTQVRRVMRLTLLAPEVIERLVGAPDIVPEQVMRRPWPCGWVEQRKALLSKEPRARLQSKPWQHCESAYADQHFYFIGSVCWRV